MGWFGKATKSAGDLYNNAKESWSGSPLNPSGITSGDISKRNPWISNNLPQFRADDPYHFKLGGYNIDWRDPRVLALALGPMGIAPAAYGIARQQGIQKEDRRLERQYAPVAQANANVAAQNAAYGGVEGGTGDAMAQNSFDEIMALLEQEKRAYRKRQNDKEAAAITQLLAILGAVGGGIVGGPVGATAGYSAGQGVGQTATPYLY